MARTAPAREEMEEPAEKGQPRKAGDEPSRTSTESRLRLAAEVGDTGRITDILRPELSTVALSSAADAGTLVKLLTRFQLPLARFPAQAHRYLEEALCFLASGSFDSDIHSETRKGAWLDSDSIVDADGRSDSLDSGGGGGGEGNCGPSPAANLLANYVLVARPVAEAVMNGIVEEMVVLPEVGGSFSTERSFPKSMGVIYLEQDLRVRPGRRSKAIYHPDSHEFQFSLTDPKIETSAESPLTIPEEIKRQALIPLEADSFVYVHTAADYIGGFLYLSNGKPIALSSVCFDLRPEIRTAMAFKETHLIPPGTTKLLEHRARPIGSKLFASFGVRRLAWLLPGEEVPGVGNVGVGGFAYFFDDPSRRNIVITILGIGEIFNRAVLGGDINAAVMPEDTSDRDLIRKLSSPRSKWRRLLRASGFTSDRDEPVRIARLKVPDPLNPVVLHGLAFTPRGQVLDTVAARAIAQAAYERMAWAVILGAAAELISLLAISWITMFVRQDDPDPGVDGWASWLWASLAMIGLVWLKNVTSEVLLLAGFYRHSWVSDYLTVASGVAWLHIAVVLVLLIWLGQGLANGFEKTDAARPMLAFLGGFRWMRFLYCLRGVNQFRLGRRLLPILATLVEVTDFIFIIIIFSGACVQAFYALSLEQNDIWSLVFSTYRLGFLGDFDVSRDVLFLESAEAEPAPWDEFQYTVFMLFSLVVTIALTNIFIGVMGNAYDHHQERAWQLFVRTRARLSLDHALRSESSQALLMRLGLGLSCHRRHAQAERLWFCFPRLDEQDSGKMAPESDLTIRSYLSAMEHRLGHRFQSALASQQRAFDAAWARTTLQPPRTAVSASLADPRAEGGGLSPG